jgi:hypothetical protein
MPRCGTWISYPAAPATGIPAITLMKSQPRCARHSPRRPGLLDGAEEVGDPIAVLPVLFHLL